MVASPEAASMIDPAVFVQLQTKIDEDGQVREVGQL